MKRLVPLVALVIACGSSPVPVKPPLESKVAPKPKAPKTPHPEVYCLSQEKDIWRLVVEGELEPERWEIVSEIKVSDAQDNKHTLRELRATCVDGNLLGRGPWSGRLAEEDIGRVKKIASEQETIIEERSRYSEENPPSRAVTGARWNKLKKQAPARYLVQLDGRRQALLSPPRPGRVFFGNYSDEAFHGAAGISDSVTRALQNTAFLDLLGGRFQGWTIPGIAEQTGFQIRLLTVEPALKTQPRILSGHGVYSIESGSITQMPGSRSFGKDGLEEGFLVDGEHLIVFAGISGSGGLGVTQLETDKLPKDVVSTFAPEISKRGPTKRWSHWLFSKATLQTLSPPPAPIRLTSPAQAQPASANDPSVAIAPPVVAPPVVTPTIPSPVDFSETQKPTVAWRIHYERNKAGMRAYHVTEYDSLPRRWRYQAPFTMSEDFDQDGTSQLLSVDRTSVRIGMQKLDLEANATQWKTVEVCQLAEASDTFELILHSQNEGTHQTHVFQIRDAQPTLLGTLEGLYQHDGFGHLAKAEPLCEGYKVYMVVEGKLTMVRELSPRPWDICAG